MAQMLTGKCMKMLLLCTLIYGCISCTKQEMDDPNPMTVFSEGKQMKFPSYNFSSIDFCKQKLYTIQTEGVMISFIADSLYKGNFIAGINVWGAYSEPIQLTIDRLNAGKIVGRFSGLKSSGILK
jgi:hypothetical protein